MSAGVATASRLARAAVAAVLVALAAGLPGMRRAQAAATDEAGVQAAYVLNFVRYSRWPGAASGPVVIAVLGTADDAAALRDLAQRAGPLEGRAVSVRLLSLASIPPGPAEGVRALGSAMGSAQVVYVGATHQAWSRVVAAAAAGKPVLTVGHGRAFVDAGGMFGLYREQGHVRFMVNAPVIKASSLDVSARLFVLARPAGGG